MKIIGLQIENTRRIKAAEMQFADKGLIQIKGQNGQGKTTILDCLTILFQGDRYRPDEMVRKGEQKAKISVDLGLYEAEKIFTDDGKSRLSITEKATKQPVKNPQKFLTDMVNSISFNPFSFLNLNPVEKNRFLMKLLKIDFTEINQKLVVLENERTITGREVDRFGLIEPVNPAEKVSLIGLSKEKQAIEEENAQLKKEYQEKTLAESQKQKIYENALNLYTSTKDNLAAENNQLLERKRKNMEEIKRLQAENLELTEKQIDVEEKLENLTMPDKPDIAIIPEPRYRTTEHIDYKIEEAENINIKAHEYEQYLRKRQEKEARQAEYDGYTAKIENLRQQKLKILAETPTGVPGLTITEEAVYHNEISSENWSDAQGIDIACRLCIAQKPELKAVFIDRGESFDKKRLATLEEWAKANDIQAFITIVDEIPENLEDGVFYIEEGEIITK